MGPTPADRIINVLEPATGVSVAPSVVLEFTDAALADLANAQDLPATVILHLSADLDVTDARGATVATLSAALRSIGSRVIPAFYVSDEVTATRLSSWLGDTDLIDGFVVSSQPELVAQVRRSHPLIRGIIDCRAAGSLDLPAVRHVANANLSRIVLLPQSLADRQSVEYLQQRLMTVWVGEQPADVPTAVNHFNLVSTGANGIVTVDAAGVIKVLGGAFPRDRVTLVRKPFVIGHRGIPALAPENTLEGARLAFEHGSDLIENDIHVTTDGQVVIHHDETLDRTTTGTGSIASRSLAELDGILANFQFPDRFPEAGIPTLASYFESFRGTDVVHVVEIKSADPAIIRPMVELIREYQVEDQVVAISFHADQIRLLHRHMPGLSAGFLTGGQVDEAAPLRSVCSVLEIVQPLSTTYNPYYGGLGRNFLEAAKHRGITSWPWTFRAGDEDEFKDLFLAGLNGLTTDCSHWSGGWVDGLTPAAGRMELAVGSESEVRARAGHYDRTSREVTPEIVVLSGADIIRVAGATITGQARGTAWVTLRHWQDLGEGRGYFMYTGAIAVEVTAG